MANKDHSLDDKIIRAAYDEFLSHGFRDASLHTIADKAGVTTGAIYTRYKNKDALFTSLLGGFMSSLNGLFAPAAEKYAQAGISGSPEDMLNAIAFEEQVYFDLLTDHYEECTLFFCRSDGSSVEAILDEMMKGKAEKTVEFLQQNCKNKTNPEAIRFLIGSQFWYFRQLLNACHDIDSTIDCLKEILKFTDAGWKQLFEITS